MTFSDHLLALRERHGLTQREAAEGAGKVREHFAASGVHHHGHALGVSLGGPAQLGEFLQHLGRDIIHAEVPQILQGIDDFGFPCTGKAGDNN